MYIFEIGRQLKLSYTLADIRNLPYHLSHKIFSTACIIHMKNKKYLGNTLLRQAVLSLKRVFVYKTRNYNTKALYELESFIKYTLHIPEGCGDNEFLEYIPVLDYLIHTDYGLEDLIIIANDYSNVDAISNIANIINKYDKETSVWSIDFVARYTSKGSVVNVILKILTLMADHPESIANYPESMRYNSREYEKLMSILWDERHTWTDEDYETRYDDTLRPFGPFLVYLSDSVTKSDMRHESFTEFGRYNSRNRKYTTYNFQDLMYTVKDLSKYQLIWLLHHIVDFDDIPFEPDPIQPDEAVQAVQADEAIIHQNLNDFGLNWDNQIEEHDIVIIDL